MTGRRTSEWTRTSTLDRGLWSAVGIALMGASLMLITPTTAQAARHVRGSGFTIDNNFDASVDVFMEGQLIGQVAGDSERSFRVRPGAHRVTVRFRGDELLTTNLNLMPGRHTEIDVKAPWIGVQVTNQGRQPVFVELGHKDAWLTPGATTTLTVRAGDKELTSYVSGRYGQLHLVEQMDLFVGTKSPMRIAVADTPIPGRLTIRNTRSVSARAYIDGSEAGIIKANSNRTFTAEVGQSRVLVVSADGHILYDGHVGIERGETESLALAGAVHNAPAVCQVR